LKLFSFSSWKISNQALLAFNVSVEKSAVILMGLPLHVISFFLSYSLQYSFSSLCICCINDNMLWGSSILSGLFGVLEASCIYMGTDFYGFGESSVIILLNIICIPFACTSSSSIPMVLSLVF
jgi:hypothetical protein